MMLSLWYLYILIIYKYTTNVKKADLSMLLKSSSLPPWPSKLIGEVKSGMFELMLPDGHSYMILNKLRSGSGAL